MKKIAGFTLLEIMVSMVILSISVAGMLAALTMGHKSINVPDHRIAALNFAQQTIEDLKGEVGITGGMLNAAGSGVEVNYTGPSLPTGTNPASELKDTFGGGRRYTVTNIGGDESAHHYKKVTVTVSWIEP